MGLGPGIWLFFRSASDAEAVAGFTLFALGFSLLAVAAVTSRYSTKANRRQAARMTLIALTVMWAVVVAGSLMGLEQIGMVFLPAGLVFGRLLPPREA